MGIDTPHSDQGESGDSSIGGLRQTRLVAGTPVSPIGLGAATWSLADLFVPPDQRRPPDDELAIQAIHTALDSGVTLIDTAHVYTTADHPGHNEALVAKALARHPAGSDVLVATKGGHYRAGDAFAVDTRRDTIREHCETSLRLLGVDRIALYQLHWPTRAAAATLLPDPLLLPPVHPDQDMRSAMAAFAELRDEGLVREVGVCNVSLAQLQEAMEVVPIASVQNHLSPSHGPDEALIAFCEQHGIAFLAYSPLGRQELKAHLAEQFPAAAALARRKGVTIQRLALAWLLTISPAIVPISGATRPESIRDSAAAAELVLTDDEVAELDFGRAS